MKILDFWLLMYLEEKAIGKLSNKGQDGSRLRRR
jgi:hypothetical protein